MSTTLSRDVHTLGIIFSYCNNLSTYQYNLMLKFEDQAYSLLRLWHSDRITFEGITEKGWQEIAGLYEWLTELGMTPII